MEAILVTMIVLFLFGVYAADIVCNIIGLCQRIYLSKKRMLITTIVCNSILTLFDILTIVVLIAEDNITFEETLILAPSILVRIGLFIALIINYICTKKKQAQIIFSKNDLIRAKPKLSILFGILIGVFGAIACTCAAAIMFFLFAAMFGAWGELEEYLTSFGLTCAFSTGAMIASIILCIVFKKKENRRRLI